MLTRVATAKVMPTHHNITRFHLLREFWQHFIQAVFRQLGSISRYIVATGNNDISIYIIAKFPNTPHNRFRPSISLFDYKKFRGSVIWPVNAVAATVAGLPR